MGNPMKMGIGQPPLGVSIPATMDGKAIVQSMSFFIND